MIKNRNWNFVFRSNIYIKKEIETFCTKYNCSLQEMVANLINIGIAEMQSEEILSKITNVKKIIEGKGEVK